MSFRVPLRRLRRTRITLRVDGLEYLNIDLAALMATLAFDPYCHQHRLSLPDGTTVELLIEEGRADA